MICPKLSVVCQKLREFWYLSGQSTLTVQFRRGCLIENVLVACYTALKMKWSLKG